MAFKQASVTLFIREVLKEKGIPQKALQEALGVTQATVSYIVNGKTNPSLETLQKIAEFLGVPVWRLLTSPEEAAQKAHLTHSPDMCCPYCGKPLQVTIGGKE